MSPDDLVQCVDASPMAQTGEVLLVKGALYWVVEAQEGFRRNSNEPILGVRVRALSDGQYLPPQRIWSNPAAFIRAECFRPFGGIKQTETDQEALHLADREAFFARQHDWWERHRRELAHFNCRCVLTAPSNLLG